MTTPAREMPMARSARRCASTMSATVTTGKRGPQRRPSGAIDDGPVEP